jgi:glyoxylase-like metal-dependent hydrolase (beta-lactamase superfamily II)
MAVIDPGAGREALQAAIGERLVDMVINTHWHFDHISGNYLFPETELWMNPIEAEGFSDLRRVAEWFGVREVYGDSGVTEWIKKVADPNTPQTEFSPCYRHEWWLSTRSPDRTYSYDQEWQIGQARMIMVHAPGHTRGSCCPYFPDEGLVYTGDYDLTSFGPSCANVDGDFNEFIASARRIAQLDADWFLTGHQAGMLSRSEFRARLEDFLDIINKRQQHLIALLEAGVESKDIHQYGLLYPPEYQVDPCIYMWERVGVRKHLELLKTRSG